MTILSLWAEIQTRKHHGYGIYSLFLSSKEELLVVRQGNCGHQLCVCWNFIGWHFTVLPCTGAHPFNPPEMSYTKYVYNMSEPCCLNLICNLSKNAESNSGCTSCTQQSLDSSFSSSFLKCPQSCSWLFWHFRWCLQSPHFSSGHKPLKLVFLIFLFSFFFR